MVYCTKCGTQNEEGAKFCAKCGADLHPKERWEKREEFPCFGAREKRVEDECFGIPYGGAIVGVIFGAFIIILGLAMVFGLDIGHYAGAFVLVAVGLLIILAAVFAFRKMSRS